MDSLRSILIFSVIGYCLVITNVSGQTFVVNDRSATVTNANIRTGGLTAGDTISFQGAVNVAGGQGVSITPVLTGLSFTVETGASIFAGGGPGFAFDPPGGVSSFDGRFLNNGSIISAVTVGVGFGFDLSGSFENTGFVRGAGAAGVTVINDLTGSFNNSGTILGVSGADGAAILNDLGVTGRFLNTGTITGEADGVYIGNDLLGRLVNYGLFQGGSDDGLDIDGDLSGTLINYGRIISSVMGEHGVEVEDDLTGDFYNYGFIQGADDGVDLDDVKAPGRIFNYGTIIGGDDGLDVFDEMSGSIFNYGSITAAVDGLDVDGDLSGLLFNCGIIEGAADGLSLLTTTGTVQNHGGRIQGGANAISLGAGNGTLILSGPSHLVGLVDGQAGMSDVLKFQNMRGITDAKRAELVALAAADSAALTTVTLFGETISWQNFEDIQAVAGTLVSYQSLITDPGLQVYAASLDNVTGLNDSFRQFLKGLNDVDAGSLNDVLSNTSGRTVSNALGDLFREQDVNFFHMFSNQFSSLRGDVSGPIASNQSGGVQSTGLFSQEVPVGMSVGRPPEKYQTWVTSYVGNGTQGQNASRAAADYDKTSILFGRGTDLNENWYLGGFGGYARNEGQVDRFGSYLETNGGYVGANAQFRSGDVFANFAGAIGFQDVKSVRRDFLSNRMDGDTDSIGGFLYTQMGRDFYLGEENDLRVTPYLGMTLSAHSVDGYSEAGPVGTSLRFADESTTTFQTILGVNASCYHKTSGGWLRPRADLAWWHAYDGDQRFSAGLAAPGLMPGFSIASEAANQNRGVFQIGIEFGVDGLENWVFEAGYFGVLGDDDYSSHGGTVGARVEF